MTLLPVAGATGHNRRFPGRVIEVRKSDDGEARSNSDEGEQDALARTQVRLARSQAMEELLDSSPLGVGTTPMSMVDTYTSNGRMHSERLDFRARTVVSGDEVEATRRMAKGLSAYVEGFEFRFRSSFEVGPADQASAGNGAPDSGEP
ncbi:MAG: hypothetical protein ACC652_01520 [Acidimicrobiales bacterium]